DVVAVNGTNGNDIINVFGAGSSFSVVGLHTLVNVTNSEGASDALAINALGGNDGVTATTTPAGVVQMRIDGGTGNDTLLGSQGADSICVGGDSGGVRVSGLHTTVNIFDQDPALDSLTVNGQGGDDVINAQSLRAGSIQLTMNGGLGNDLFIGSDGDDLINGGDGNDTALMGAGDDVFVWNPGDDN